MWTTTLSSTFSFSLLLLNICLEGGTSFTTIRPYHHQSSKPQTSSSSLYANGYNSDSDDANKWQSSEIPPYGEQEDWEDAVAARQDGSLWSSFTSDEDNNNDNSLDNNDNGSTTEEDVDDDGEAWLDALAKISADEIDFINVEADRADKVRQMQEMEFSSEAIAATLGVEVDESREIDPENILFEKFKEETSKSGFGMYLDDEYDMETVESHTTVEIDEDTNEPVRAQMVYVDEVTCIGCTNCAMVAQSTFFMEQEHGRARVFEQWGDDDETIAIAIETCPVDCIHYVPYDELKALEIERRDQNINFKARLVNQGEYGGGTSQLVGGGGATAFTGPQKN
jgi:ferredoxin